MLTGHFIFAVYHVFCFFFLNVLLWSSVRGPQATAALKPWLLAVSYFRHLKSGTQAQSLERGASASPTCTPALFGSGFNTHDVWLGIFLWCRRWGFSCFDLLLASLYLRFNAFVIFNKYAKWKTQTSVSINSSSAIRRAWPCTILYVSCICQAGGLSGGRGEARDICSQ